MFLLDMIIDLLGGMDIGQNVRRAARVPMAGPGQPVEVPWTFARMKAAKAKSHYVVNGVVLPDRIELSTSPLPREC
ncbi:MAG TPA: hypothetical protein VFA53_09780, partial [Xanthobacteraceae bacterium]|nr:hypothetical protein [Xanthobacteraceae bacterium]